MSCKPLEGKVGIVFGVANKRSIAWFIAKAWAAAGAKLYFSYQGDRLKDKVAPLVAELGFSDNLFPCDVSEDASIEEFFNNVKKTTDKVDMMLHAIAFAPKEALQGRFMNTGRDAYKIAMDISAYSLVALTRAVEPLMPNGGSVVAMSYYGSEKVIPNYNMMGVAKAALEATTRYLAWDLGKQNIRVNCISAGPMQTLAARGVSGLNEMFHAYGDKAPLGRSCTGEELGATATFLASEGSASITGQVMYVDGGYEIMGM